MDTFKAFRIHNEDGAIIARYENLTLNDLSEGTVVIRSRYSGINYKDALAATGAGKILRTYPLVGGIDVSGSVEASDDDRFKAGDAVVVTGCGLSETVDGGYSEIVRTDGESVIAIPAGLDEHDVMVLGTAGFTAALAIHKMEHNGQTPDNGPVVVTGATGGVGSFAVNMLAGRGYEVVAVSGKVGQTDYLKNLGASDVLARDEIDFGSRALEKTLWAGAVDTVGGEMLTWLTRTMGWWGNIACIGLAGSHKLQTTVMPFILRGINLLGINSMATPRDLRLAVWQRLADDLKPKNLDLIGSRSIDFDDLHGAFQDFLDGKVIGRTVVNIA